MKLYCNGGPNPMKVLLLLEEGGVRYSPVFVDTGRGEHLSDGFKLINPNRKLPALEHEDRIVFDSNAILLHLATYLGKFTPSTSSPDWARMLSWLMFIATGLGPYSGQAVHFLHAAPEDIPYARKRYAYEARRHYAILDEILEDREFILGSSYSIVDMAAWGWGIFLTRVLGEAALADFPNFVRMIEAISTRPAAQRARSIIDQMRPAPAQESEVSRNLFQYLYK